MSSRTWWGAEVRRYVLWGSSGHAKVLDEAISRQGGEVFCLFDNSPFANSVLPGVPLLGGVDAFMSWTGARPMDQEIFALVAIGGAHGQDRLQLQELLAKHGLRIAPLIHPLAFVADSAMLGPGTQLLAMSVVAAGVHLGAGCIVNHKASIDHECIIADGVHVAPGATICGCVTVGTNSMIGAGAVVMPRLKIGRDSIIGAGAVVTRNVPDGVVVMGNPALVRHHLQSNSDL